MNRGGFTLLQTLTVLAILGILMAIGIPNLAQSYRQQKLVSGVQDVVASITEARSRVRSQNGCYRLSFGARDNYQIERFTTRDCTGSAVTTTTAPYGQGVVLQSVARNGTSTTATATTTNATSVTLISPFATNADGLPLDLTFAHLTSSAMTKKIRISGVLGTVIMP